MAKCSFCESQIAQGTGKMYIKKEGKVLYFCGSKCEKNAIKLERKATKLKWTQASRKKRGKKGDRP